MNKEELYQKLGGIYGGQKELIDEVVNAFVNLKIQNDTLMSGLMITRQKYNNDKAKYRRKAKMYRDRINKAKKYMYENMIDVVFTQYDETHCYWNMIKADDVELVLEGKEPLYKKVGGNDE